MTTKCTCTKDGFNDAGVDTYGCPLHSTPTVEEIVDKPCPFCGHKPKWQLTKVKYCQLHGDPIQDIIFGCFSSNCEVRPRIEKPSVEICRAIWNKSLCNQFRFEEGVKAERQFILNVLDGIDIADGECNTKAIRKCLEARYVCRDNGPSFATEEENDWFVSIGAPRRCNQCKLEGNHGVCDKKDCKNYPKNKQLTP